MLAEHQSGDKSEGENAPFADVLARFRQAQDFDKENRDEALEDFKMVAGEQWAQADITERTRRKLPTLTINRLPQFVKQVTGEIRRNSPSIKALPSDGDADTSVSEVLDGIIRSIENLSQARSVYSRAAEHAVSGGMGHFRLTLEYPDDQGFDLEPRIRSIRNPFSVVWDPNSVRDDKSDAEYCFVYTEMDRNMFRRMYPDAAESHFATNTPTTIQRTLSRNGPPTIMVAEYWCIKDTPVRLVEVTLDRVQMDPMTGAPIERPVTVLTDPDEQLLAEISAEGWRITNERPSRKRQVMQRMMSGSEWLTDDIEWPGQRIPIFTVLGEETDVGNVVRRRGLIRFAKDAQRAFNLARSSELQYTAAAPKAPWLVPDEAIEGYEAEWANANTASKAYLRYRVRSVADKTRSEPLPPPQRMDPIPSNPALMNLSAAASEDMKSAIGIYDASLGQRSNETSGRAIEARNAQADTGTYVYIDNLSVAIEACGRELVNLIPALYSTRKIVRIIGKNEMPAIVNLVEQGVDLARGRYDVLVKVGPAFESRRQEARDNLVEILRSAPPPFIPVLITKLARLGDWDDAEELANELDQIAVQMGLKPPSQQPGMIGPDGAPMVPGMIPGMPAMPGGQTGAPPLPPQGPQFLQQGPPQGFGPQLDPFAPVSPAGAPAFGARVPPQPLAAGRAGMGVR